METTKQQDTAALTIVQSMRALRNGKITADDYRATMARLRSQMSEDAFEAAKFRAAANDR